jgi:putative hydroxymethylpyrimidine transport system permease protein
MFKRGLLVALGLFILWQLIVMLTGLPDYILPSPLAVLVSGYQNIVLILQQLWPTLIETLLGLLFGSLMGMGVALSMALFRPLGFWLLPVLLISQAIPTFALAPVLVIWFGYGMASKIMTTMIMLFFPVASSFYEGLRRTEPGWLDLAKTMNASKARVLWHIRVPAALPALAAGLRIAAAIAPIGAVIGEWVGASRGLGFLILNSNARMQIALMFACLLVLVALTLSLYFCVDYCLKRWIVW